MKSKFTFLLPAIALVLITLAGCKKNNPDEVKPVETDPFVMVYEDFITPDDVKIISADTTTISVSTRYMEKMGITNVNDRTVTIWRSIGTVPFVRIINDSKVENDRIILSTVKGEFSDMFKDVDIKLDTDLYINKDYVPTKVTRSGSDLEVDDVSAKYTDEDGVIHPAVFIFEPDEYSDDLVKVATKSESESFYVTAEELMEDNLTLDLVSLNSDFKIDLKFPNDTTEKFALHLLGKVGMSAKLSAFVNVKVGRGGLEKFEAGLKGSTEYNARLSIALMYFVHDKYNHPLATLGKKTTVFWVGPVPVPFTFQAKLNQKTEVKTTGAAHILASGKYRTEFETGCRYLSNAGWQELGSGKETTKHFSFDGFEGTAKLEAKSGLYIEASVSIAGSAGPFIACGPSLSGQAEITSTFLPGEDKLTVKAQCGAYAELGVILGARVTLLGHPLVEWLTNFSLFKLTLYQGSLTWVYTPERGWDDVKKDWIDLMDSSEWKETITKSPYRLPDEEMNF